MFKKRSYQKELLDEPVIDKADLNRNLKELEIINKWLGGHRISIKGLRKVVKDKKKTFNIVDIGCGGGDSLKVMAKWASKKGYKVNFTGVDLLRDCIDYAQNNCKEYPQIAFKCADFKTVLNGNEKIDAVHASLFFHHFNELEIIDFIKACSSKNVALIINDLERNRIAYHSIKLLTRLFSKSRMVKNDAPLSVLRGFKKAEWCNILAQAGIKNYIIKNCSAFRHLLVIFPNE